MKKTLLLFVICILLLMGCQKKSFTEGSNVKGSIENPYKGDGSEELELNCEKSSNDKNSKIVINLESVLFEDHDEVDNYYTHCYVSLLNHSGEFPIDLGDYVSILYYDENDCMVGENEYKFHYSETADKVGLVFSDTTNEGPVDHSISDKEINDAKLSKVALQYYQSGKQKKVFFSLAPSVGVFENPISIDEYGLYNVIYGDEEQIDTGIFNLVYDDQDGFSVQMDIKYYSYFDYVKDHTVDNKIIDLSEYYSISYFDEQGIIGESEYGLKTENESACSVQVGEIVTVMSHIPEKDLDGRIPSMIAFNYYSHGKERTLYVSVENPQS